MRSQRPRARPRNLNHATHPNPALPPAPRRGRAPDGARGSPGGRRPPRPAGLPPVRRPPGGPHGGPGPRAEPRRALGARRPGDLGLPALRPPGHPPARARGSRRRACPSDRGPPAPRPPRRLVRDRRADRRVRPAHAPDRADHAPLRRGGAGRAAARAARRARGRRHRERALRPDGRRLEPHQLRRDRRRRRGAGRDAAAAPRHPLGGPRPGARRRRPRRDPERPALRAVLGTPQHRPDRQRLRGPLELRHERARGVGPRAGRQRDRRNGDGQRHPAEPSRPQPRARGRLHRQREQRGPAQRLLEPRDRGGRLRLVDHRQQPRHGRHRAGLPGRAGGGPRVERREPVPREQRGAGELEGRRVRMGPARGRPRVQPELWLVVRPGVVGRDGQRPRQRDDPLRLVGKQRRELDRVPRERQRGHRRRRGAERRGSRRVHERGEQHRLRSRPRRPGQGTSNRRTGPGTRAT